MVSSASDPIDPDTILGAVLAKIVQLTRLAASFDSIGMRDQADEVRVRVAELAYLRGLLQTPLDALTGAVHWPADGN